MSLISRSLVLPSIMSADFLRLGDQIQSLLDVGARVFHVDVMDGHFVPNLTVGPGFAAGLAKPVHSAGGMLDVHLMVERPGAMIEAFAPAAGAISVHVEADPHSHRLLGRIQELGCLAGLAINPGTPPEAVVPLAGSIDYINVMSVNPGFAGQTFIAGTPDRVARLRELIGPDVVIQVDGGVSRENLASLRDAGATWFVSASSIFGADDPAAEYQELARLAEGA